MKRNLAVPVLLGLILLATGTLAWAQEETPPLPPPAQQPQVQQAEQQVWSPQELNNLVAPIALYPDPLLSQMLVASTYPLEVVEAKQWLQQNKNLGGRELMAAAKQQPWDPSVQALVAVPDALAKLNEDIRWTTDLGDAFLAQQAEVMNAVQEMRARAENNGNLTSTPQQTVTNEAQGGQQVIAIQPADPQVIYVPYYDPLYVWGPPVYGYYPPLYYSGFGFGFGRGFNLGFYFDDWGGWGGWGWGPSWFGRSVFINNSFFPRYGFHRGFRNDFKGRTIWAHDPGHRLGVSYGNHQVAARFEGASRASRNSFRAGAGSRVAATPYANRSADRFAGRTGEQGYRNMAPQQRYQAPQQYRAAAPQNPRSQSRPQQRYQAPQQYRAAAPQSQRLQSQLQQRYQAPQQYPAAAPQNQRLQSQPQQRYQAPQQYRAAAPQSQRFQSQPQQRYQAQQQYRAAAPQGQRFQSQPQQRYQAPQQYRSAPQMSGSRFSGGGSFGGGHGSNGGGGHRR
jgi:uncharacterized membrane protein YgcG